MAAPSEKSGSNVKVVARVRPSNEREIGTDIIAYCDSTGKNVTIDVSGKCSTMLSKPNRHTIGPAQGSIHV